MKLKGLLQKEKEVTVDENKYIPGSSEKKRATMMYFFFGIIASLSKKEFSPFEYYHIKQAIGLWVSILPIVLLCLIPLLKWIAVVVLIVLIAVLVASCISAWNGKYYVDTKKAAFSLFAGIGGWFVDLFDLGIKVQSDEDDTSLLQSKESNFADLQMQDTSLQEDIEKIQGEIESKNNGNTNENGKNK